MTKTPKNLGFEIEVPIKNPKKNSTNPEETETNSLSRLISKYKLLILPIILGLGLGTFGILKQQSTPTQNPTQQKTQPLKPFTKVNVSCTDIRWSNSPACRIEIPMTGCRAINPKLISVSDGTTAIKYDGVENCRLKTQGQTAEIACEAMGLNCPAAQKTCLVDFDRQEQNDQCRTTAGNEPPKHRSTYHKVTCRIKGNS